ncbi:MAG: endonuclease/exonuclease/phosphatase family protein [Blastocatellia bacterium]
MLAKALLASMMLTMIAAAIHFSPYRERSLLATRPPEGPHLKLMTWNIGYADPESDSRAHIQDMRAIAAVIGKHDPDAVALQELAGEDQLQALLAALHHRYKGAVAGFGSSDRVEAVLVKSRDARFESFATGDKYSLAATFKPDGFKSPVILISAHADAFNAARRRIFTGDLVDWANAKSKDDIPIIGGDFNFELSSDKQVDFYSDNLKNDSEAYAYIMRSFRDLGKEAGFTTFNDRRIDYIFGPPEAVLFRQAEVLNDVSIGHMDHFPLLVEVSV